MMTINELSEKKLMTKAAQLYYENNLSILSISKLLGVSRQRCSRLLKKAREVGIVQIKIHCSDYNHLRNLEKRLQEVFHLKKVVVTEVFNESSDHIIQSIAEEGAHLLNQLIQPNLSIGVASGRTLYELVQYIKTLEEKDYNIKIIELIGGLSRISANIVATEISRSIAKKLHAKVYFLPAPAFTKDQKTRDAMLKDSIIKAALSEKIDLALVGIGNVTPQTMLIDTETITKKEYQDLLEKKAVGVINGTFFDIQGKIVEFEGNQRRIAVPLTELKKVSHIIGVAGGLDKVDAIVGALRGGFVNLLVIDNFTAEAILKKVEI